MPSPSSWFDPAGISRLYPWRAQRRGEEASTRALVEDGGQDDRLLCSPGLETAARTRSSKETGGQCHYLVCCLWLLDLSAPTTEACYLPWECRNAPVVPYSGRDVLGTNYLRVTTRQYPDCCSVLACLIRGVVSFRARGTLACLPNRLYSCAPRYVPR